MAIVPQFQGGTPQVRDSGGTGFTPVQAPQNNYDYGKVLKEAMRPVEDFSKSFSEALRINHVRTVKAESDDAERQAVGIINTYLSDPDNGYLTKSGKNAMDGYAAAVEGMQADVNKIVGALSPQTREAVNSRIQDRLTAAVGQARNWYTKQTQSYHLKSSQDKVDMLVRDYAEHYGDQTYRAKTWNALQTEIDYQVNLLGLPKESAAKYKKEFFNQAQAARFGLMADDSPVDALAAFKADGETISPDVRSKLNQQLFARAKSELAIMAYAQIGKQLIDKKDFLREAMKPGYKTGIDLIDSLSPGQRIQVLTDAYSQATAERNAAQADLRTQVANSVAVTQDMGADPNPVTREQFVQVYGEQDGGKRFEAYTADVEQALGMYQMKSLDNEGMQSVLDSAKPIPGAPDYAEQKKRYEGMKKAALSIVKKRHDDPIAFAVQTGAYGFQTLNIGDKNTLTRQLGERAAAMPKMARQWGVNPAIFSDAEAKALTESLDKATPEQQTELLAVIADAVGEEGIAVAGKQLKGKNDMYGIAMAGMGIKNADGSRAGELYLRGQVAITRGIVKMDARAVNGDKAQLYEVILQSPDGKTGGLYATKQAADTVVDLALGIMAAKKAAGSSVNHEEAIALAVGGGGVVSYRGKKVVAPRGRDVEDVVEAQADVLKGLKGYFYRADGTPATASEFASNLPKYQLVTKGVHEDGSVTYGVIWAGLPVFGPDRKEFTFRSNDTAPMSAKARYWRGFATDYTPGDLE